MLQKFNKKMVTFTEVTTFSTEKNLGKNQNKKLFVKSQTKKKLLNSIIKFFPFKYLTKRFQKDCCN